jgi:heme peroxidase
VDRARADGVPEPHVFDAASRDLRWHYQTAILREFLPSLIGDELTKALLRDGPRFYRPDGEPFIPLEFADAAYRYGHSQIRHRYTLNSTSAPTPIFPDLIGFRPVPPEHEVDWSRLFDAPDRPPAARAKKIDGRLVSALIALPVALTGDGEAAEFHSLAVRDLERGQGTGLPSGEALARHLGEVPLSADEVAVTRTGWRGETPLWYYVLREADVRCGGDRLGPVGGRIVGDVLLGLLEADETSVRHAPAAWEPAFSFPELLAGLPNTA